MKKPSPEHTPLQASIEDGQIVIRIGIAVNSFAALAKNGGPLPENLRIDDDVQFAEDTIRELNREDEVGNTLITKALDAAVEEATNQGSTAVRALKRKARDL